MCDEGAGAADGHQETPAGGGVHLGPAEAFALPPRVFAVLAKVMLPVAAALWGASLRQVRLDRMTGLGLVSVLPVLYWAALAVLTAGFALALADRRVRTVWLAGYVTVLIAVLHATPSVLYPALRYSWAWKHVWVVSYLTTHHGTAPPAVAGELAAYYQWPGFFALNALFLSVTGLDSVLSYASWAPPVNNLAMIAPLYLIYRTIGRERWLVWGGLWVFSCANWIGQDYFSPQAFSFTLYLVVVAVVLRYGSRAVGTASGDPGPQVSGPAADPEPRRAGPAPALAGLFLVLLILMVTIASSHQLTPILLVCTLVVLIVVLRSKFVVALLAGAVAAAFTWNATVAWPFVHSQLPAVIKAFGNIDANARSGVIGLKQASRSQVIVARVDRALTGLAVLLAVVGLLLRRVPRRPVVLALLVAPLPLFAASNYGNEILYRVYLFALPALALCVAGLICRPARRWWWIAATARCVSFAALLAGFLVSYYGKEQSNYFSPAEVTASKRLFESAPPGSLILAATSDFPGAYTRFWEYPHEWFGLEEPQLRLLATDDAARTLSEIVAANPSRPGYVILTRGQQADSDLTGLFPPGAFGRMEQNLNSSPLFTVIYQNKDATVYRYVPPAPAEP
ncbi:MAG: glycosyltransferase [Catenulispora sp.]